MTSYILGYKKEIGALWKTSSNEIRSLNGLRAISAVGIFLFHTWSGLLGQDTSLPSALEFIKINLFSFVDLFFVLSGFLVYGSIYQEYQKNKHISILQFYKKRAFRILPAYYFYLLVAFVMLSTRINELESLQQLTEIQNQALIQYNMAMTRNFFDFVYMSDYFLGIHPHSWSLAIEFKFYILLPLFAPLLLGLRYQNRIPILFFLYLVPLVFRTITHIFDLTMPDYLGPYIYKGVDSLHIRHQANGSIYHFFHTRFDALIIGMIIYEFYTHHKVELEKRALKYFVFFISMALFAFALTGFFDGNILLRDTIKYNAFNLSFAGFIISSLTGPVLWKKFWSMNFWTPLARISYSFYLWNMIGSAIAIKYIYKVGLEQATWQDYAIGFTTGFAQILVVSFLVYVLIEAPFLALKNYKK